MLLICLWYAFDMHWDAHSQNFMPAPASVQVWNQLCQSDPIWIFNFHQLQPNAFDPSPGHRPIPSPGLRCCGSWSKSHLLGTLTLSRWQGMTMVWQWCDNGDHEKNKWNRDFPNLLRLTSYAALKTRVSFVDSQYGSGTTPSDFGARPILRNGPIETAASGKFGSAHPTSRTNQKECPWLSQKI